MSDAVRIRATYHDCESPVFLSKGRAKYLGFDPDEAVDSHYFEYNVWIPGSKKFDYNLQVYAYEQDFDYVISDLKITNDYVEDDDKEVIERLFDTIFFRGRHAEIFCEDEVIKYDIEEMECVGKEVV